MLHIHFHGSVLNKTIVLQTHYMINNTIPKTDQTRMIIRMAGALGVASVLAGCASTYEPYAMEGTGLSPQGTAILRTVLASAQNATVGARGGAGMSFQTDRFINNLSRSLPNQVLNNYTYPRYGNLNRQPYYQNYNNGYRTAYNNYGPNYQNPNNNRVYNPNPSHREAYLQRRAATKARNQYYRGYDNGYGNQTGTDTLYKRLPNGQFIPVY
jgi:hypothetical protein